MSTKHIGFKGATTKVESEGYSPKVAAAIVASSSRKAVEHVSKNKALRKVKS